MRRLSRLDRSIERLWPQSAYSQPQFICSACLLRAPFSTSIKHSAEPEKLPRTERLRRRIWGTDQPPGLKDPYGGPSFAEEIQAAKAIEASKSKSEEAAPEPKPRRAKTPQPVLDASYEPAKTWAGLEEVGELPAPEFNFMGYMPAERVVNPYEATAALHRAVVEVITLRQNSRPLSELSNASIVLDETVNVQISVSRSNPSAPLLTFPEGSSAEAVLASLKQISPNLQDEEAVDAIQSTEMEGDVFEPERSGDASIMNSNPTEGVRTEDQPQELTEEHALVDYQQLVTSWKSSWLQISLEDNETKFAIVKRVMQLTGIHIPDSAIYSSRSIRSLLAHIVKRPKAVKLFDALAEREDLVTLPNVKIFNRRITPIDKEKNVGRWKIIEKELLSRGLPVTGQ